MKIFKYVLIATTCLSVSACMESDSSSGDIGSGSDFSKSQSVYHSNVMQNFSTQSQQAFTKSAEWLNLSLEAAGYVDFAAAGITVAADADLDAGYCVDDVANPEKVKLISWFDSADSDGNFISPAGGTSSSSIFSELTKLVPGTSLGTYNADNKVKFVNGDSFVELFDNCAAFSDVIPNGAPVIVTDIEVPQKNQNEVTKIEYRTMPCASGQVGHRVEMASLSVMSNGSYKFNGNEVTSIPEAAWQPHADYCQSEIQATVFEGENVTVSALNTSTMNVNTSSAMYGAIEANLGEVECVREKLSEVSDEYDEFDERGYTVIAIGQNPIGKDVKDVKDKEKVEFDTCSSETKVEAVDAVAINYDRRIRTESHVEPCGGASGSYADTHLGHNATVDHTAWTGNVEYEREILAYDLTHNVSASATDGDRTITGAWYGVNISCQRDEVLTISCNDMFPAHTGANFTITDNRGFVYRRTNEINGWQNAAAVEPNPTSDPAWVFDAASSGCVWRQTRDTSTSCAAGYIGNINIVEARDFMASNTGTGTWSAWTEVSRDMSACQPAVCTSTGLSWMGTGGKSGFCSGAVGTAPFGHTVNVVDGPPGNQGSAQAICDNGTWRLASPATATCIHDFD
jgi:hypothetical protein